MQKDKNIYVMNLHIQSDNVPDEILEMRLKDLYCKHMIRCDENTSHKAEQLLRESQAIGYDICEWGLNSGHPSILSYHLKKIVKMEKDGYDHAIRIVKCKYDFNEQPVLWIDNLHSAVKYIRQYGKQVKIKDIPFYIVDISNFHNPVIIGYNGSLKNRYEDILGAVSCAYKRFRRSNSKNLISIRYTLDDFLTDNQKLLNTTENDY